MSDKLWFSEQYFNTVKLEDKYEHHQEYEDFQKFLQVNCLVYPTPHMSIHNLFILHHVFYEQKIAINFHLEKFTKPFDHKPSQMQKLA